MTGNRNRTGTKFSSLGEVKNEQSFHLRSSLYFIEHILLTNNEEFI
jgi:hypothetical protein